MPSSNGSKGRKKNALSEFFEKNKSLTILLPVLVVAIVVVIILYSNPGNTAKPTSAYKTPPSSQQTAGLSGQSVEVLPQMERITQPALSTGVNDRDPFSSSSSGPVLILKGLMLSSTSNTAIIETEDRAYVVSAGDKLGETWNVIKIEASGVTLIGKEGNEVFLEYK